MVQIIPLDKLKFICVDIQLFLTRQKQNQLVIIPQILVPVNNPTVTVKIPILIGTVNHRGSEVQTTARVNCASNCFPVESNVQQFLGDFESG